MLEGRDKGATAAAAAAAAADRIHQTCIWSPSKMANSEKSQLESALNTLLNITEKSGNLRKDLRQDIIQTVSTLRNIFVNLKNKEGEYTTKISQLERELNKAKADTSSRVTNLQGRALPSRGCPEQTLVQDMRNQLPPSGGPKKSYSEALTSKVEKRFKIIVKSKSDQPTEAIKNALKTSVNPKDIRVGIKAFKSMKDGRVFIEAGTQEEINSLKTTILAKCGEELEVTTPKLWRPRLITRNVPQDIPANNLVDTIHEQNPELEIEMGEIEARFKFQTKRGQSNMVIEVGPETRKKLVHRKIKIGWLICDVDNYLVVKRCFRCSRPRVQRRRDLPPVRWGTQAKRMQSGQGSIQMRKLHDV